MDYIFDLYGTLIDSQTDCSSDNFWGKAKKLFNSYGVNFCSNELKHMYESEIKRRQTHRYAEPDFYQVFEEIFLMAHIKAERKKIEELAWQFRQYSYKYLHLYSGVNEMLSSLKSIGVDLYILSNAQRIFAMPTIRYLDLEKYFTGIAFSSDFGIKKPSPKFFECFYEKFHLNKSKTVYIGNNWEEDIVGSKLAGIRSVYVKTNKSLKYDGENITENCVLNGDFTRLTQCLLEMSEL